LAYLNVQTCDVRSVREAKRSVDAGVFRLHAYLLFIVLLVVSDSAVI